VSTEIERDPPPVTAPAVASEGDVAPRRVESARRRGLHDKGSLVIAAVIGLLLILWAGDNSYRYSLMQTAAAYALIGVGVYIPFIMGGSLSLAYAAYASIGGYSVALVADKTSIPVVIGWVIGPIVAGFAAVVLGQLTRRLSGLYLAAITYLFAQAFQSWLNSAPGITGGESGISNLRPTSLLGWIPSHRGQIVLAVILVLAVGFVVDRLRLSPWGVSLRAMKEVPAAVEATGIRVPMLTLVGLGLGAAVASLGGALFTTATSVITPSTFTLNLIFLAVFMSLLGGQGTPWGAIAGAVLIVELTLNVPYLSTSGSLLVAAVVLLVMLVAPNGVLGIINGARTWIMRIVGGRRRSTPPATTSGDRAGA
jgi:branched-chain amino acid transport system permease protein